MQQQTQAPQAEKTAREKQGGAVQLQPGSERGDCSGSTLRRLIAIQLTKVASYGTAQPNRIAMSLTTTNSGGVAGIAAATDRKW